MKMGIYFIENKNNGKIYIGSSVNIKQRISKHKSDLRKNKHHSCILQRAWNKYGEESFEFKLVEEVFEKNKLKKIEHLYFIKYNPHYNIEKIPNNGFLGKTHSKETKDLISKSKKGLGIGYANPMFGKTGTNHHNYGKKMPQNGKSGVENWNYGKPSVNRKKVQQFDLDGKLLFEFESLKDACQILNIHKTYISGCCNGKFKKAKGFIFKYKI
jgi:group I intron endonuclease